MKYNAGIRQGRMSASSTYSRTPKSLAWMNTDLMLGNITEFDAVKGVVENTQDWHRFVKIFQNRLVRVDYCFIDDTSSLASMRAVGYIGDLTVRHIEMQPNQYAPNEYCGPIMAVEMLESPRSEDPAFLAAISLPPLTHQRTQDFVRATFSVVE